MQCMHVHAFFTVHACLHTCQMVRTVVGVHWHVSTLCMMLMNDLAHRMHIWHTVLRHGAHTMGLSNNHPGSELSSAQVEGLSCAIAQCFDTSHLQAGQCSNVGWIHPTFSFSGLRRPEWSKQVHIILLLLNTARLGRHASWIVQQR